jgi:hypothetical protein
MSWIELSIAILQVDVAFSEFKQYVSDVVYENDQHTDFVISLGRIKFDKKKDQV